MKIKKSSQVTKTLTVILLLCTASLSPMKGGDKVNWRWQQCVLSAINDFPLRGGYYTGGKPNATFSQTTWQGLHRAFKMSPTDSKPEFNPQAAQPSFCSSATYGVLIKALLLWDTADIISTQAWRNMKPYVGISDELNPNGIGQDDGVGFWGRVNANGPALAVLVREIDAGFSFSAYRGALNDSVKEMPTERYLSDDEWRNHEVWKRAVRGDIMKIFWNRNASKGHDGGAIIGYDGVRGHLQEAGHSVIFLGISTTGKVMYWSSNGPGSDPAHMGYSVGSCDPTDIQRVVFTRILRPERFDAVRNIAPDNVNTYLYELNGVRHSNTEELKRQIGEK